MPVQNTNGVLGSIVQAAKRSVTVRKREAQLVQAVVAPTSDVVRFSFIYRNIKLIRNYIHTCVQKSMME